MSGEYIYRTSAYRESLTLYYRDWFAVINYRVQLLPKAEEDAGGITTPRFSIHRIQLIPILFGKSVEEIDWP